MSPVDPRAYDKVLKMRRAAEYSLLYVIATSPAGPVKIGITRSLARRLSSLQIASPAQIHVYAAAFVERSRCRYAERGIHRMLDKKHLRGEWFDIDVERACRVVVASSGPDGRFLIHEATRYARALMNVPAGQTQKPDRKSEKPKTNHKVLRDLYLRRIHEMSRLSRQCPAELPARDCDND